MNKLVKDALVLTCITVIAGFALGLVYEITKAPIANAQAAALQEAVYLQQDINRLVDELKRAFYGY